MVKNENAYFVPRFGLVLFDKANHCFTVSAGQTVEAWHLWEGEGTMTEGFVRGSPGAWLYELSLVHGCVRRVSTQVRHLRYRRRLFSDGWHLWTPTGVIMDLDQSFDGHLTPNCPKFQAVASKIRSLVAPTVHTQIGTKAVHWNDAWWIFVMQYELPMVPRTTAFWFLSEVLLAVPATLNLLKHPSPSCLHQRMFYRDIPKTLFS